METSQSQGENITKIWTESIEWCRFEWSNHKNPASEKSEEVCFDH